MTNWQGVDTQTPRQMKKRMIDEQNMCAFEKQ